MTPRTGCRVGLRSPCDANHIIHYYPYLAGAKKAIKKEKNKYKDKGKKDSDSSDLGENKKSKHVSFEKLSFNRKSSKRSYSHVHSTSKYNYDDEMGEAAYIAVINSLSDSGLDVYVELGSSTN